MVVADYDVGWNQSLDSSDCTAEKNALAGRLQVVIEDSERSSAVPTGDGLRLLGRTLDVGDVAVPDNGRLAVQGNTSVGPNLGIAMDVKAIEFQIRCRIGGAGCRRGPENHQT